jgi:hypothetical protein
MPPYNQGVLLLPLIIYRLIFRCICASTFTDVYEVTLNVAVVSLDYTAFLIAKVACHSRAMRNNAYSSGLI